MTTQTTLEKPILIDNVYEFKPFKKNERVNLNSKSKIFVVLNSNLTSLPIEKLFVGHPEIDNKDIMGYSILQMLTASNGIFNKLKIDENTILDISFIDEKGIEFYISKIRRPFAYKKDKPISIGDRLGYIDLLLTNITVPQRPSVEAVSPEPSTVEPIPTVDIQVPEILGGELWEKERTYLSEEGAKEYVFNEYRFFYEPASEGKDVDIAFFELVPGHFINYSLYEEDITDDMETFSFIDKDDTERFITFDKKEQSIAIVDTIG